MKYEEMNDISTILVEPADEKGSVVHWVSRQHKPVIIVVPENAQGIFQRPEDFRDLKRVKRHLNTPVTLVIEGNERLRDWARRHGFPVYSSTHACAQKLVRYGTTEPLRHLSPTVSAALSRTDSGKLKLKSSIKRGTGVVTEPLQRLKTESLPAPVPAVGGQSRWRDGVLLVLLVLLGLGILGGLGFGYLLTTLHLTPVSTPMTPFALLQALGCVTGHMYYRVLQTWSLAYAASTSIHSSAVVTLMIRS